MTEDSILWTTSGTGDGAAAGYNMDELIRWMRQSFIGDNTDEGVLKNYLNELEVTGVATPVSVNTGAAYVYGFPYWNTAAVNVAVPAPAVATRIDYIVLRASWAAQTVRITRIEGVEGAGAPPALTQTDGVTWDVPLATTSTTIGGVITVTDAREFLHPNIEIEAGMLADDVAGDGLQITGGAISVDVSDFAGDGLVDDGAENLDVNVDDATIEISGNALQIKAGGLDNSHLANRTRTLWVPATECENVTDGTYENQVARGWECVDAKQCDCYGSFYVPSDFVSSMTARPVFESPSAGDARVDIHWNYAASGEAYNTHSSNTGVENKTIVANQNSTMTAAGSLAAVAAGDYVLLRFVRSGVHVDDTVGDVVYFVGFLVSYTADM